MLKKYKSNIKVNFNSIFLNYWTKEEVKSHILSCKESTLFYTYNLSNHILKQIIDYTLVPLVHIFIWSLTTGTFPNLFTLNYLNTLIVPLFKHGKKQNCSNYHPNYGPISLIYTITYTLSKILKKCLRTHCYNFLEKSDIFSENKFGSRHIKGASIPVSKMNH